VIGCHQKGIRNVVAPLGTALTEEQLHFLSRYCTEVILIFDADSAGETASLRTLSKLDGMNLEVRVGMLPKGEDPFDLVQKQGERVFMTVVDSALKPVDYRLSKIAEAAPKRGTIASLLDSFAVIKEIPYETQRSDYLKKISALLSIEENTVRRDFTAYARGNRDATSMSASRVSSAAASAKNQYLTRSYQDLLKLLCRYPVLIDKAAIDFSENNIPDEQIKRVFSSMVKLHAQDESFSIDKMFDIFHNGPEMDFLNECLNSDFTFDDPDAVYTEIFINLRLYEIDDKIESCVNYVKTKKENLDEYLAEIEVLKREKEKLNNYLQNRNVHQKQ
jgi:DNA primase